MYIRFGIIFLPFLLIGMTVSCAGANVMVGFGGQNSNSIPYFANISTPGGLVYTHRKIPAQIAYNAEFKRTGRACSYQILFHLIGFGDSSIEKAKQDNSVTKIAASEYETNIYLGSLYVRFCNYIAGE